MSYPTLEFDPADQYDSLTEILFKRHSLLTEEEDGLFTNPFYRAAETAISFLRKVPLVGSFVPAASEADTQVRALLAQQRATTNYANWLDISTTLDRLLGNDAWKEAAESDYYDHGLVAARLAQLRDARESGDYKRLLYLVRTTFVRNAGNIGNVNLYRHSYVGTKRLIEEYIDESERCLELLTSGHTGLDPSYVLQMFIQTRKNIGRTALVLSGGGCFGLIHIGVLSTLMESDLLPKIVSGSSAGSIVASILCSNTNDEIRTILSEIGEQSINIFDDAGETVWIKLSRFLKYGTWFDSGHLQSTMYEFLGDLTFRESYNRTGRILNITVSPASIHEQPRLLNYLTAPSVLIWSAVCASCSLPGVFASSTIYEKVPRTRVVQEWNGASSVKYVDGSVDNDVPITRLSEMFNVGHIIACQVNPHVAPLLKMSISCVGGDVETEYSAWLKQSLSNLYGLMASEVIHYLDVAKEIGIARNLCTKATSILSQKYSGDITILPELHLTELHKILQNPNPAFFLECTVRGARATWPKMTIIRNHCALEFALDRGISQLRSRLISNKLAHFNSPYTLVSSPVITAEEFELEAQSTSKAPHRLRIHASPSGTLRGVPNSRSFTSISLQAHSKVKERPVGSAFGRRRTLSSVNLPHGGSPAHKAKKPVSNGDKPRPKLHQGRFKSLSHITIDPSPEPLLGEEGDTACLRRKSRKISIDNLHNLTRKSSFEATRKDSESTRKAGFVIARKNSFDHKIGNEIHGSADTGYSKPLLGFDHETSRYSNGYMIPPGVSFQPRSQMHSRTNSVEINFAENRATEYVAVSSPEVTEAQSYFPHSPSSRNLKSSLKKERKVRRRSGSMTLPSLKAMVSRTGSMVRIATEDSELIPPSGHGPRNMTLSRSGSYTGRLKQPAGGEKQACPRSRSRLSTERSREMIADVSSVGGMDGDILAQRIEELQLLRRLSSEEAQQSSSGSETVKDGDNTNRVMFSLEPDGDAEKYGAYDVYY